MGCIYIFTEDYRDTLVRHLGNVARGCFGGLNYLAIDHDDLAAKRLADVAADVMGTEASPGLAAKISDFLSENNYIHLDAFIRICLEEYDV